MRGTLLSCVIVGVTVVAAGCGGSASKSGTPRREQVRVLTFASQIRNGQPEQLERFAEAVKRRTGGRLQIRFAPDWRRDDPHQEFDTVHDVQTGKVELAWVGTRAWDWIGDHAFDALSAPFLIDSQSLQQRVFAAGIPRQMASRLHVRGVVMIGVLPGPLRTLVGRRPLTVLGDLRGARIGVQGLVATATFRALGANPRQFSSQPSFTGFDGMEEQASAIVGNRHYRVAHYLSAGLELWPRPMTLIAAKNVVAALPRSEREALRAAAAEAVAEAATASRREDADANAALCTVGERFVPVTARTRRALQRAVATVYAQLRRDRSTAAALAEIESLKRQVAPAQAPRCLGATSGAATHTTVPTPIDGAWDMNVVPSTLAHNAAYGPGHPTAEDVTLDRGDYRLTLHNGRAAFTLRHPFERQFETGRYAIAGSRVTFHWDNGNDAGETWRLRWSIYRGLLRFRLMPHGSPPNLAFAPWRRVAH